MLQVQGLRKSYGKIEAVRGIDFTVRKGQLFAFLGPNGAGKSTTIDMLCTLLRPDGGKAVIGGHVLGEADDEIRRLIGVVFQESVLDKLLTVRENLATRGSFYGLHGKALADAVDRAAQTADVTEFIDRPFGKLSGGQRRRADIARALVHTPRVLFLDEPTTGLDPKTKEGVWQTVTSLQQNEGMTVFLTTHYMEEAATADYIVLLNRGEVAAQGTPYDLMAAYSTDMLRIKPTDRAEAMRLLDAARLAYTEHGKLLLADLPDTLRAIPLLAELAPHIESFEVVHGSMEDVFLKITGGVWHDTPSDAS